MNAPSIVRLDLRVSRAAEAGRGVDLTALDLDLLVSLGLIDLLHEAKTEFLKEQTRCRVMRRQLTTEENTGSTSSGQQTGSSVRLVGTSFGTTTKTERSAEQAFQRARRTSGRPCASSTKSG